MGKDFVKQLILFLILFAVIALVRSYFDFIYLSFFVGGLVGMILPDIDHLIYVYFLRPQDLTSQRVSMKFNQNDYSGAFDLIRRTHSERDKLIFHSVFFQLIFVVFAFWLLTSTGSLFARGIAIGFLFHLVTDQLIDLMANGSLENWLRSPVNMSLDKNQTLAYWSAMLIVVLVFSFLF